MPEKPITKPVRIFYCLKVVGASVYENKCELEARFVTGPIYPG